VIRIQIQITYATIIKIFQNASRTGQL
jgi:hypothetical protein